MMSLVLSVLSSGLSGRKTTGAVTVKLLGFYHSGKVQQMIL